MKTDLLELVKDERCFKVLGTKILIDQRAIVPVDCPFIVPARITRPNSVKDLDEFNAELSARATNTYDNPRPGNAYMLSDASCRIESGNWVAVQVYAIPEDIAQQARQELKKPRETLGGDASGD